MAQPSRFSFSNSSKRRPQIGWMAPALAAALLAAGCGSHAHPQPTTTTTTTVAPTSTAAPTTTTAPTTVPTADKTCLPAQLTVVAGSLGVAAGTVGRVYQLQNSSSTPCSLFGYPGLALLNGASQPLPTTVVRQPGQAEVTVTLAPGGSAYFTATWPDGTGFGDASCPTSADLEITPPNDTAQIVVTGSAGMIQAFGGTTTKLQCGTITVTPVRATSAA